MVGDGPDRHKAEQWVREQALTDFVYFVGNVKEPDEILAGADLFLLPSESESFGLAALEAMALGVPVVSSNTGGLPEVNEEGISGGLCEVGDVDGMAIKSLHILRHFEQFSKGARETAKKFDLPIVLNKYLQLYYHTL